MTPFSSSELGEIASSTLGHYQASARSFWEGTRDHDVSQNREALLRWLPADRPQRILDLGCGPGRDLRHFVEAGHQPTGLDGSAAFCVMAREWSGCEVLHQSFMDLSLPEGEFDGVFANASLFHVPTQILPSVLRSLHTSLRSGGVLIASNPRGDDQEGFSGERYGVWHSLEGWRRWLTQAGFEELEHYYRPPGRPRAEQPWLVTVWRRD